MPGLVMSAQPAQTTKKSVTCLGCKGCTSQATRFSDQLIVQGVITQHPTGTEDYSIRGKFKVPINFHVGSMGLAQATNVTIDSVVPMMGGQLSL